MIPTLLGVMTLNFFIIQLSPGGPVEQMIAKAQGMNTDATVRFSGVPDFPHAPDTIALHTQYKGARGMDPAFVQELERMYGFDKPILVRYGHMLKNYATFDFGRSYFKDRRVLDLIAEKLPVSLSLGFWATLLIYLIAIPLGIAKAQREGTPFDMWTSFLMIIAYAIPAFLWATLMMIFLGGGSFWDLFPLRGLVSENWANLSSWGQFKDYVWHLTLPVTAMVVGGFASLTLLTKNSFIEELYKHYVRTARAKGLSEHRVLYRHVFVNAMIVIVGGVPRTFTRALFSGALLIEVIFSLDGLGLLGFESAVGRDYPVVFGTLFIFTLINLIAHLCGDLLYMMVDPRVDFEKRAA